MPSLNGRCPGGFRNNPVKHDRGGRLGKFCQPVLAVLLLVLLCPTPAWTTEIHYVKDTTVHIPFLSCTNNQEIQQVLLCVSENNGKDYKVAGEAKPSDRSFQYTAPGQGSYWFVVQAEYKSGKRVPASPDGVEPELKVCVDTTPPVVTLRQVPPLKPGFLTFTWDITDEHLDSESLRLDYRLAKEGPVIGSAWTPLDLPPDLRAPQGQLGWTPMFNVNCEVRLSVRDRAGNTTERLIKVTQPKTPAKSEDTQEQNNLKALEEKLCKISDEVDELKKKLAAVAEKLARTEAIKSEQTKESGSSSESPVEQQEILLRKVDGRWVIVNPEVAPKKTTPNTPIPQTAVPRLFNRSSDEVAQVPSCALVGNRLENMALRTLDGDTWEYKRDRRGRLLLLSFWSSACVYCKRTNPHLCDLQKELGRYGLEVIGIACEDGSPAESEMRVRAARNRQIMTFQTLLSGPRPCPVQTQFQVDVLPKVFLLDEYGTIVWKSGRSGLTAEKLDELRQEITRRLRVQKPHDE